jgi:hypothetical protein
MIGFNRFLLVAALLAVLPGFLPPAAYAKSAEIKVCPVHDNNKVKQIDIFDGDPKDLAYLAPDDDASNTYTVSSIYEHGSIVTVRCKYTDGAVVEVPLTGTIDKCVFSRNKQGMSSLTCKQRR